VVSFEEGQTLANEYQMNFLETSAKQNLNVEAVFLNITREITIRLLVQIQNESMNDRHSSSRGRLISSFRSSIAMSSCCCCGNNNSVNSNRHSCRQQSQSNDFNLSTQLLSQSANIQEENDIEDSLYQTTPFSVTDINEIKIMIRNFFQIVPDTRLSISTSSSSSLLSSPSSPLPSSSPSTLSLGEMTTAATINTNSTSKSSSIRGSHHNRYIPPREEEKDEQSNHERQLQLQIFSRQHTIPIISADQNSSITPQHQQIDDSSTESKDSDSQLQITKQEEDVHPPIHSQRICANNLWTTMVNDRHHLPYLVVLLPVIASGANADFLQQPMQFQQDRYSMYFICAYTYQLTLCGSSYHKQGFFISRPKSWIKRATPILKIGLMLAKIGFQMLPGSKLPALTHHQKLLEISSAAHVKYLDAALEYYETIEESSDEDTLSVSSTNIQSSFYSKKELRTIALKNNKLLHETKDYQYQDFQSCFDPTTSKGRNAHVIVQELIDSIDPSLEHTGLIKSISHETGEIRWIWNLPEVEASFQEYIHRPTSRALDAIRKVKEFHEEYVAQEITKENACCTKLIVYLRGSWK
jgi:hypothetical protein